MPRTPEESRSLFDRWASSYDRDLTYDADATNGPLAGYAQSLTEATQMVRITQGTTVLDVGIGTGAFADRLADRGASVSGVDPSSTFTAIPFGSASFDAAVSSFAFHEPAERSQACADLARVVRPGGRLCLLDNVFASPAAVAEARQAIGAYWDDDEEYPMVGDLDALLRSAGFVSTLWRQTAPCHWVVRAQR